MADTAATSVVAMAAISDRLNHLAARQAAAEAAVVHVFAPVLLQVAPDHALKLIAAMRSMNVSLPGADADALIVLATDEHIQRLADQLQQKVLAMLDSGGRG